jgi:hypothetical protein
VPWRASTATPPSPTHPGMSCNPSPALSARGAAERSEAGEGPAAAEIFFQREGITALSSAYGPEILNALSRFILGAAAKLLPRAACA